MPALGSPPSLRALAPPELGTLDRRPASAGIRLGGAHHGPALQYRPDFLPAQRLELEQRLGNGIETVAVIRQDPARGRLGAVDQTADFSSMIRAVASETFLRWVTEWPRKDLFLVVGIAAAGRASR